MAASPTGTTVAVGAPFARGGGSVLVLRGGHRGKGLRPSVIFGEGSKVRGYAVPGTRKGSTWFGASVAVVHSLLCPGSVAVAAGLPYKGFKGKANAGRVVVVGVAGKKCRPTWFDNTHGLTGKLSRGTQVGRDLAVQRRSAAAGGDRLVVTAPNGWLLGHRGVVHVVGRTSYAAYVEPFGQSDDAQDRWDYAFGIAHSA